MDSVLTPALRTRLSEICAREEDSFHARIPRSRAWVAEARSVMPLGVPSPWMASFQHHAPLVAASGTGTTFTDLDGNTYHDFNLCDLAMAAGFASPPIVEAISRQATLGNHFLLPTESSLAVSRLLGERFGLPCWQYTLSASGAVADALRLARAKTGRDLVLTFSGKYHGHLDEMLWSYGEPDGFGLASTSAASTRAIPFNDLGALADALAASPVAAVISEPAMTNCGLVLPDPTFHAELRRLAHDAGALVISDVTHTQFAVLGGGLDEFAVSPDIVVGGKGIGGGVPVGVVGMTSDLAGFMESHLDTYGGQHGLVAGGTLYGNALSLAAAQAGLQQVFTAEAHTRVDRLGSRLQEGLQGLCDDRALPFSIDRWGGRTQWRLTAEAPTTGEDGFVSADPEFVDPRKAYGANRGVWDAIASSGPGISFAASESDVDLYLEVSAGFLDELVG
jgi:glutamate-1-semialdehyde 2,1-aminomutase